MTNLTSLRMFIATLTTLALAVPVWAQTQAPATPPVPQAQAPQGPVLRLSIAEAIQMAMDNQLDLKAARLGLQVADHNIAGARSAFLPILNANINGNNTERQPIQNPDGTSIPSSNIRFSGSTGVNQALPWLGGRYSVSWNNFRNESTGGGTFNPALSSSFSVNFTQPLWQDFGIDPSRFGVESAERNRVVADLQLQQSIVALEVQVQTAYLNLISAIERNKVANENMRVAEESLRQARARVEVGVSPEIEIIENEATVESGRDQVISSEADIQSAKDSLRRLILAPDRPDYWAVDIEPTESIAEPEEPQVDVEAAIANALANRLDLQQIRRNLEITDLGLRLAENNTRMQVDAFVNYQASADGGTRVAAPLLSRDWSTVLGDTFSGAFPSWTVGLQVGYPLGQSAARANLARQEVQKQQQLLNLRETELFIAEAVRNAARRVVTTYRQLVALRRSREAQERQLEAEERRFEVGLSSTFQLQTRQQTLFNARFNEVLGLINHQFARIAFERVQKIQ